MSLRLPDSVISATLDEPVVCKEHCVHTWQCTVCGALVHGTTGRDSHEKWHRLWMSWVGAQFLEART